MFGFSLFILYAAIQDCGELISTSGGGGLHGYWSMGCTAVAPNRCVAKDFLDYLKLPISIEETTRNVPNFGNIAGKNHGTGALFKVNYQGIAWKIYAHDCLFNAVTEHVIRSLLNFHTIITVINNCQQMDTCLTEELKQRQPLEKKELLEWNGLEKSKDLDKARIAGLEQDKMEQAIIRGNHIARQLSEGRYDQCPPDYSTEIIARWHKLIDLAQVSQYTDARLNETFDSSVVLLCSVMPNACSCSHGARVYFHAHQRVDCFLSKIIDMLLKIQAEIKKRNCYLVSRVLVWVGGWWSPPALSTMEDRIAYKFEVERSHTTNSSEMQEQLQPVKASVELTRQKTPGDWIMKKTVWSLNGLWWQVLPFATY